MGGRQTNNKHNKPTNKQKQKQTGVGKTSLINQLKNRKEGAYFFSGKYDLGKRNVPYSAIVAAFNQFVEQVPPIYTQTCCRAGTLCVHFLVASNSGGNITHTPPPDLVRGRRKFGSKKTSATRLRGTIWPNNGVLLSPLTPMHIIKDDLYTWFQMVSDCFYIPNYVRHHQINMMPSMEMVIGPQPPLNQEIGLEDIQNISDR